MKLIWLDLETTGLDPDKCDILEIAAAGAELAQPDKILVALVNEPVWHGGGGLTPFIRRMHGPAHSRLLKECRKARGLWTVTAEFDERLAEFIGDDEAMLAGASVHFDLGFLRRHVPYVAARLSHRVFDTSAITAFCLSLGMPPLPKSEVAHRALYDIDDAILRYQHCREWLRRNGFKCHEVN